MTYSERRMAMHQGFRLVLILVLCIPLTLGSGLDSTFAGPLTDLRSNLPDGITMKVLGDGSLSSAPLSGNSNVWALALSFERATLGPGDTMEILGSHSPNSIKYFYVDRGIVGITMDEVPSGSLLEGGSYVVAPAEAGGGPYVLELRGDESSECTNVLIVVLALCQQCGGGPIENPEATPFPENCLEPNITKLFAQAEVRPPIDFFLVRVTMNPGTSWDLTALQPAAGIIVEKGTLTGISPSGDEAKIIAGESLIVSGVSFDESLPSGFEVVQNTSTQRITFVMYAAVPDNPVLPPV
jgi:hypothetical protein